MSKIAATVEVKRKVLDGWFVYTCDKLPGLYVASRDEKQAYNDLPISIQKLIELDFGVKVTVRHEMQFDEFVAKLRGGDKAQEDLAARAQHEMRRRTDDLMQEGSFGFVIEAVGSAPLHI